jgi:hypothetical protein
MVVCGCQCTAAAHLLLHLHCDHISRNHLATHASFSSGNTSAFCGTSWRRSVWRFLSSVYMQVGIIGPDKKFKILTAAEVQDYLQEVE